MAPTATHLRSSKFRAKTFLESISEEKSYMILWGVACLIGPAFLVLNSHYKWYPEFFGASRDIYTVQSIPIITILSSNTHGTGSTITQSLIQISAVLLLATWWFCAYLPKSFFRNSATAWTWILLLWSLISAALLAVAMRDEYNPAVFFMGLAAIFVAAEHFGGLEQQERGLEQQEESLSNQMQILATQARRLDLILDGCR